MSEPAGKLSAQQDSGGTVSTGNNTCIIFFINRSALVKLSFCFKLSICVETVEFTLHAFVDKKLLLRAERC